MMRADSRLPHGRHFALTWGIGDRYGGMTNAMLRRSRSFKRIGGVDVDILTLDDRPDYPELASRLRASGELIDGLRLRNLWDDLRRRPSRPKGSAPDPVEPLTPRDDDIVSEWDGVVLSRQRSRADGGPIAVDRFRRDGSILATERADSPSHRIVLYAEDGTPIRAWKSSWSLYRWWFDRLTSGKTSFLLVDSKTAARSVAGYRRENVTTVHIVHASHRLRGRAGTLRASRATVLRRAGDFDDIVVLTARQRADLIDDLASVGVTARIRAIPNEAEFLPPSRRPRTDDLGVVVASLEARKRLKHVVDAIAQARAVDQRISLDLFGEGPRESEIRRRARSLAVEEHVRLRGFDPDARTAFQSAGFSLLTSTSEGLPLVLIESMAAGCIPIAYDIRYGPADMIHDGLDGFLVAEGDIRMMAQRIVELRSMPAARVEMMRKRAMARAAEFSDVAVTRQWARELRSAFDAKRIASAKDQPLPVRLRRRAGVVRRRIQWATGR
ncbi:glycosyltransferase [Microbacterium murale]|uniref:Poly(Glycerol-phosphate) alpha-glucosyltransferase n=1 Tax=Microbacterium murale TaxID=1081040 RepID=A0ABU0PD05_9MICO|nr:glycosyltransferase [Microbacterium murale]MDQ0645215.1 poly(glycerol-phosphate) alpha-glucosyltransferase [Microbacterium murale]